MTSPTTEHDWTILEDIRVTDSIATAANRIGTSYAGVTTVDDMAQEAAIIAARNAEKIRGYLDDPDKGKSWVYTYIKGKLRDIVKPEAEDRNALVPFHIIVEREGDAVDG